MKELIGQRVSAISDWGTYRGKMVKGILSYDDITNQYLITINKVTTSVMEETIKLV